MKLIESVNFFTQKTSALCARIAARFPNTHILAVSALCVFLTLITALPSDKADAKRNHQQIEIPDSAFTLSQELESNLANTETDLLHEHDVRTQKVSSGDTLSSLFSKVGLTDRHMMNLISSSADTKILNRIKPGHELDFAINSENELHSLTYRLSQLEQIIFEQSESGYRARKLTRTPETHLANASGTIEISLYEAGLDSGLSDRLIMSVAEIFGWDIDFALDMRKGDSFKVVYEERFLDGEKIGNGEIVAAEFTNQGDTYRAVRYTHENGDSNYYTPEGKSMRKAFLRAPLDFRRISSNFNPRRLHPIFKTLKPHRGIDYAAPRGTPVWSSGDGKVIASGYSKANGNYVVIQHGGNIQTKYLHLHKRYVKTGQRIKQRQKIGSVGSTGYATGPHLHYEFVINGVHRNPRTIVNKLPKAKAIASAEMARFRAQTAQVIAELNIAQTTKLAKNN